MADDYQSQRPCECNTGQIRTALSPDELEQLFLYELLLEQYHGRNETTRPT